MVEIVIFKVKDFYCGYVRGRVYLCAFGETAEEVAQEIINNIEVYEFIQMELALTELLNELNISRPYESDEPTTD
jgi:hypothetical protein